MERVQLKGALHEGEPVFFNNPHGWTEDEVRDFFNDHLVRWSMAFNIKLMGLQFHMNRATYETEQALLEGESND